MVSEQKNKIWLRCERCSGSDEIPVGGLAFVHGMPTHLSCLDPEEVGKNHVSLNLNAEFDRLRIFASLFGDFMSDVFSASLAAAPEREASLIELQGGEGDPTISKEASDVCVNTAMMLAAAIKAASEEGPEAIEKLCAGILEAGKSTTSGGEDARIFTNP